MEEKRTDQEIKETNGSVSAESDDKLQNIGRVYTHIAHALARGYTDLYYVNIDTDEFIEFHTNDEHGVLNEVRRGKDFFEGCERDVKYFVHEEDQEAFVKAMNRDFLKKELDNNKVFELTYRRIIDGNPRYVLMKVSLMEDDKSIVVLAVSDIDELMRQRRAEERIQEERLIYARLHALTGNFICVYVVDPETDHYREFSSTDDYETYLGQAKEGTDFFGTVRDVAKVFNHPEDLSRFLTSFTKEKVMGEVERGGIFSLGYRLIMDGKPRYVQMKGAMVEEKEGPRLVVGLNDIDAQMRQEEEYGKQLAQARLQLNVDALTGIRNKHAYGAMETKMNRQIEENTQSPFAIVMLDVNDLKVINDTKGHQAGDLLLKDACRIICDVFKRSPVFRVGGDEFVAIAQGNDYEHISELLGKMSDHNAEAIRTGGVVIACGMSRFGNDKNMAAVYARADQKMYEDKSILKSCSRNN